MMFSEFISQIAHYLDMPAPSLLFVLLLAVVCGAVARKVVSGIQSDVTLAMVGIVLLAIILGNVGSAMSLPALLLTECLVVVGHEAYRRLLYP